ncbi:MAG TPA: hypothetical protein VLI55_21750 [Bryobacteraceae bacterium]|nr:hypothetical protein [Bryobacteraceae bacterium]
MSTSTDTLRRIGLWLGSLLVSVSLFSLSLSLLFSSLSLLFNGAWSFRVGAVFAILRVTMTFAFPVWCLYLPFVLALRDAEGSRIWTILVSGILIGPAALALLGLILQLRGGNPHLIWHGDPLLGVLGGIAVMMFFAAIIGFLTTSFYVIALKLFYRRSTVTHRGVTRT